MSIFQSIFKTLKNDSGKELLAEVRGEKLVNWTGQSLSEAIGRFRLALQKHNIAVGDRVALWSGNCFEWVAADLAIIAEGAVMVPLYDRQEAQEVTEIMTDAGAKLVLSRDPKLQESIAEIEALNGLGKMTFEQVNEEFKGKSCSDELKIPDDESAICTIIYTSGTSGRAKGVILTYANVNFMVPQTVAELNKLYGDNNKDENVFHYLPFCFAGSRVVLWTQLFRSQKLMMSTDLTNLIQEMGTAKPNYFLNVPKLLERVRRGVTEKVEKEQGFAVQLIYHWGLDAFLRRKRGERGIGIEFKLMLAKGIYSKIRDKAFPSWDFLICGSAPLSEETQAWFQLLGVPVYQVYGLTETTAICTMDKPEAVVAGKVGYAIDGITMKLADNGEVLIKGPNIFSGYWQLEEKTKEVLTDDGWFHTGDLGEVDADGNWSILGRMGNLLVPESGHNVAPEPIEQALKEADQRIEQAVIVGHGKRYLAAILTGDLTETVIQAALDKVNAELPHYRHIHGFYHHPTPLSYEEGHLTANEKLRRREIDRIFENEIKAIYR